MPAKGERLSRAARRKVLAGYRAWYEANLARKNLGRGVKPFGGHNQDWDVGGPVEWEAEHGWSPITPLRRTAVFREE